MFLREPRSPKNNRKNNRSSSAGGTREPARRGARSGPRWGAVLAGAVHRRRERGDHAVRCARSPRRDYVLQLHTARRRRSAHTGFSRTSTATLCSPASSIQRPPRAAPGRSMFCSRARGGCACLRSEMPSLAPPGTSRSRASRTASTVLASVERKLLVIFLFN